MPTFTAHFRLDLIGTEFTMQVDDETTVNDIRKNVRGHLNAADYSGIPRITYNGKTLEELDLADIRNEVEKDGDDDQVYFIVRLKGASDELGEEHGSNGDHSNFSP